MHPLTVRAVLSAFLIFAGTAAVLYFHGSGWTILLPIIGALCLLVGTARKSSKVSGSQEWADHGSEIGHANSPPTFGAEMPLPDRSYRQK